MLGVGIVQKAQFQGEEPLCTELDGLHRLAFFPVPNRQAFSIVRRNLCRVEALQKIGLLFSVWQQKYI